MSFEDELIRLNKNSHELNITIQVKYFPTPFKGDVGFCEFSFPDCPPQYKKRYTELFNEVSSKVMPYLQTQLWKYLGDNCGKQIDCYLQSNAKEFFCKFFNVKTKQEIEMIIAFVGSYLKYHGVLKEMNLLKKENESV